MRRRLRAGGFHSSVGLTDDGLILGAGSVLVRMAEGTGAVRRLALDADRDRLLAMLSVARGEPVARAEVLHHVEAASRHWQHGDKALANLRLVFARLPCLADKAAAERRMLAEDVLDGGTSPDALMKALWPDAVSEPLGKYNPAQPRVPAGNGIESGRWEFGGFQPAVAGRQEKERRIVVAATDNKPQGGDNIDHPGLGPDGRHTASLEGPGAISDTEPLLNLPGGGRPRADFSIDVSLTRFGEAAQHVLDAQAAGKPSVLTIARPSAGSNRAAATGSLPKVPNMHLDEYPPAMFDEGGVGASVRSISPRDNKSLGAYIGQRCRTLPDGTKVEINIVP